MLTLARPKDLRPPTGRSRRQWTRGLAVLASGGLLVMMGALPAEAQHGPEDGHIYADPALDTDGDGDSCVPRNSGGLEI